MRSIFTVVLLGAAIALTSCSTAPVGRGGPYHVTAYQTIPPAWDDIQAKKFNLWGYVDARDVAQACAKAIDSHLTGAEAMTIAAEDTIMRQTNAELLAAAFPGTTLKPGTGPHETLISIDKARRLIGYTPEWTWRKVLGIN